MDTVDTVDLMELQHEYYDNVNYKNIELRMTFVMISKLAKTFLDEEDIIISLK